MARAPTAALARAVVLLGCLAVSADGNFAFPDFRTIDGLSLQVRSSTNRAPRARCPAARRSSPSSLRRSPPFLLSPNPPLPPQGVANRTRSWLRLTPSVPNLVGSAWHGTKQAVVGGFRTDFSFRIILDEDQALPGPCKWVDHTPGSCARRGGDGFAFVVQNFGEQSLGQGGGGLGYGGIPNAVAVEFDTWFDSNLRDPYENHLAVLTRGRSQLRSEHSTHLGVCLDIPDLADGERHDVRVEYDPVFRAEAATHRSFQAAPHLVDLVYPAAVGFQHGLGVLKVWIDDMSQPVLTVPMNLAAFLDLEGGTAWVGFTASTGESHQNHEVLSWLFLELASEHAAASARAGSHLAPEQDALPRMEERWEDEIFSRTRERGEL